MRSFALLLLALTASSTGVAATYDVGPGQPHSTIGSVPWASLAPGDVVRIHWRVEPYREKWVIGRSGTPSAPIRVAGVRGPGGERPVIDGSGAVTAPGLNYWSESRGVIKIGGSNTPPDSTPEHVIIEGLEIRNAKPPHTFTDDSGATQAYAANASTIYLEKGRAITIRDCVLHGAGNGLFVASSDDEPSRDILVDGNWIYDNGNAGSIYEHNSYTAAVGIVFQHNRYGPLCAGCGGNALKDRSAGTVVRYNWIEGGNRQLDLVDAEDSSVIRDDPAYDETFVYGNVLIEPAGAGNRQVAHYGGDSGSTAWYRKGTLHFYNNTVISQRTDRTTLLRLSTADERCDARNNVVYAQAAAGSTLSLLDETGTLDWSHNWAKPGWVVSFGGFSGTFNDDHTTIEGTAPGFVDEAGADYHLLAGSACRDAAAPLHPAALPDHDVVREYRKHQAGDPRPDDGWLDVGAYEHVAAPLADFAASPRAGRAPLAVQFTDMSSNLPVAWAWDFEDDGTADSGLQHPPRVYTAAGLYSVRLSVVNSGGADAELKTAYICVTSEPPPAVGGLSFEADRATLRWSPVPRAATYDVVRGSLAVLLAGGDFGAAVEACIADDVGDASAADPDSPAPGVGSWYLVRAIDCGGGSGTYDGAGAGQAAPRDPSIASSPGSCP